MCPLSVSSPERYSVSFVRDSCNPSWRLAAPENFVFAARAALSVFLYSLLHVSVLMSKLPSASCICLCTNPLTNGQQSNPYFFLRKEVIQPHLPIRLPCYDFTPVTRPAFGGSFLSVRSPTSGISDSHGVTGGVYKTRERIHRDMLIRDY